MNGLLSIVMWLALGAALTYLWTRMDHEIDEWSEMKQWENARIVTGSGTHSVSQWNQCRECGDNVLVENTYAGVCFDCFHDLPDPVTEREWADLMRQIDDEALDEEDHRE